MLDLLKHSHTDTFYPELAPALVNYIGKRYKWSKSIIENVIQRLPQEKFNKFGLIQAITEVAKKTPNRVIYETDASRVLNLQNLSQMATIASREISLN